MARKVVMTSLMALAFAASALGLALGAVDPALAAFQLAALAAVQLAALAAVGVLLWRAPPRAAGRPSGCAAAARIAALEAAGRAQDAAMTKIIAEHGAVVREIHHRVKNNLQIVYSLLDLQVGRLTSPEAREALAATRARVSALALLHRHLYDDKDFHSVEMRAFVTELCDHLSGAWDGGRRGRIRLTVSVDDARLIADQAVGVGMIVTEAVLNARQHAFPDDEDGTIGVSLAVTPGGGVLIIADDGRGVAPSALAAFTTTGVGAALINGFAKQIDGVATISNGAGAAVTVHFAPKFASEREPS